MIGRLHTVDGSPAKLTTASAPSRHLHQSSIDRPSQRIDCHRALPPLPDLDRIVTTASRSAKNSAIDRPKKPLPPRSQYVYQQAPAWLSLPRFSLFALDSSDSLNRKVLAMVTAWVLK